MLVIIQIKLKKQAIFVQKFDPKLKKNLFRPTNILVYVITKSIKGVITPPSVIFIFTLLIISFASNMLLNNCFRNFIFC